MTAASYAGITLELLVDIAVHPASFADFMGKVLAFLNEVLETQLSDALCRASE